MILADRVFPYFVDRFVRSGRQSLLRSIVVETGRHIVRQTWFRPVLEHYVSTRLEPFGSPSTSARKFRLLVLNRERYDPDLAELGAHPEMELVSLPSAVQHLINAIYLSPIRHITEKDPDAYLRADHPEVRAARARLNAFLRDFLPGFAKRNAIDAIVTCAFYYGQDREWEDASRSVGVPFLSLHKENMQDEAINDDTLARYKARHYEFRGDKLFVYNHQEASLIERAGICPSDRLEIVGALRMDSLYKRIEKGEFRCPRRQVVLFSFRHAIGQLQLKNARAGFSIDRDEGFVEYFDSVHATIAALARDRPDVEFVIKPKWGGNWLDEIMGAIQRGSGIDPASLPNLRISLDAQAHDLIRDSAVVVGINSTTLLEAKLAGRSVVVPLFAEAAGKYYEKHVYFKKHLNTFRVARSPEELAEAIMAQLDGLEPVPPPMPPEMIEDYLGYFDGRVCDRVVSSMKREIQSARNRRHG